ncbi:MAG: hypothetical protein E6J90_00545 [Deltaproteobacteria bacterium]|nr:MAG: hypothetical protein E6J90_00545 [Deltaproteobacteria bacterium]
MRLFPCLLLVVFCACGSAPSRGGGDDGPDAGGAPPVDDDPLSGLPTGAAQWSAVCARHYGDMISAKFCAGAAPPSLTSLADLEALLGLTVRPNPNNDPTINANVRLTLNGESTGLGVRSVNPILARAFLMTPSPNSAPNASYQVLAFARGEPLVELVANDPAAQTLRFFLVRFHPACESTGCSNGDLQTAAIESGWTGYTLYDDRTIADTTLDCLNCHEPGGPGSKRILRMQELANPWAHWFYPERPDTLQIVQDFLAAHGGESYAGIPSSLVMPSRPAALTQLLQNNGFGTQPNVFDTLKINTELAAGGTSATWTGLYAQALAGQQIPPPYVDNPYDRTKEQAAITAYQQVLSGSLPRAQLPDLRDTFLDSALADMSIRPKPGLDGKGILVQMCQMCHNARLDQTLSRARFNVEQLAQVSRAEKDTAIQRLQLPPADRHAMPPARFHELSAAERQLAIDELMK